MCESITQGLLTYQGSAGIKESVPKEEICTLRLKSDEELEGGREGIIFYEGSSTC